MAKTWADIIKNRYWITPAGYAALEAAKKENEDNGTEPS